VRASAGEKAGGLDWLRGVKEERERQRDGSTGPQGKRGEGVREMGFCKTLFQIHFSIFQNSLKQETMHSNHDAQSLIISNFI
jgi:hypothetical protein